MQAPPEEVDPDHAREWLEFTDPAARRHLLRAAVDRGDVIDFARQVPALSEIYREVTA